MYFNLTKNSVYLLILSALFSLFSVAQAKEELTQPELNIKPTKCVSLQQDQVCYVNVTITWRVSDSDDYCLSSTQQASPLQCWQSVKQGEFTQEIKMSGDITYTLSNNKTDKEIISKLFPLAWVYKKEKFSHSSWRIF